MDKVLLLHTNQEYATSLANTIQSLNVDYEVEVASRIPIHERLSHLFSGKYDLVQTDEFLGNGVLACGSSILSGIPFIVSVRGWADYTNAHNQYSKLHHASIKLRTKAVLRRSQATIFLSDRTKTEFSQEYNISDSITAGRPIDVDYYQQNSISKNIEQRKNDEITEITTVTNLRYKEKYDGVITILEGLKQHLEENENLHYTVAGSGTYLDNLRQYLEEYPYSGQITALGYCDDIPDLLAVSDVFVYVSFLDAYPTVVLEAQAAGLPIIAGDAVGVPEVVGEAGLLCPPTPDGIYESVNQILIDRSTFEELRRLSREKMLTYNEKCVTKHIEVWDRVLDHS
jgi:glycosyltransferase involved in cell wall biosynthesis